MHIQTSRAKRQAGLFAIATLGAAIAGQALAGEADAKPVFQTLYAFCQTGTCTDGAQPDTRVAFDIDENLYGGTMQGGPDPNGSAIYTLVHPAADQTQWSEAILRAFPFNGAEFTRPILNNSGDLFDTVYAGNVGDEAFELSPPQRGEIGWSQKILHRFALSGRHRDGSAPVGDLIADGKGNLYGTTAEGGGAANCGTVFELLAPAVGQTAWTEMELYRFRGSGDGCTPATGLVFGRSGRLFGTTEYTMSGYGYGSVFELSPPAGGAPEWAITTLHRFTSDDGAYPSGGNLAIDEVGNLYGTTAQGGTTCGEDSFSCGIVFMLSPPVSGKANWIETVLHVFFQQAGDGAVPNGVIRDRGGNLYGTTVTGGSGFSRCPYFGRGPQGCGIVFELSLPATDASAWKETILHNFTGGRDGDKPSAGLTSDGKGNFYGTTMFGGNYNGNCRNTYGCGVVYSVMP